MKKVLLIIYTFTAFITLSSCGEETVPLNGTYSYKVRMTDAPGPYNEVNVDIKGVSIINGKGQTVNLNTNGGIQNLLELTNGADMLLASSYLSHPEVKEIRLLLGSNNTIVVNDISYPLDTPSADQSGLKIMVNQNLKDDVENEILIDFDANASIVETGNNTYKLKPVIRIIDTRLTGSISGNIDNTSLAIISATSSSNVSYTSSINSDGDFKVAGLPPGKYNITITPVLPATSIIQTNVNVQGGSDTVISTVVF